MRQLRDLNQMIDQMPMWGQYVLAVLLIAFAVASVYGRLNPKFGAELFSKVPEEEIRSNVGHIIRYTVVPSVVCVLYVVLLVTY